MTATVSDGSRHFEIQARREGPTDHNTAIDHARQIAAALNSAHMVMNGLRVKRLSSRKVGKSGWKASGKTFARGRINQKPCDGVQTETDTLYGIAALHGARAIAGRKVTGRTDQFALAVLAYALLVGRKPFDGDTFTSLASKIRCEDPPIVSLVRRSPLPKGWPSDPK